MEPSAGYNRQDVQDKYRRSLQSGYTHEQIISHLAEHPQYADRVKRSRQAGYSDEQIGAFLIGQQQIEPQEKRGVLEKGARLAGQYGLGAVQATPAGMVYEIATAPQASKEAELSRYRGELGADLEQMLEQKQTGVWSDQDEALLQNTIEQIKNPKKAAEYVQTADVGLQNVLKTATGVDLTPEDWSEKAARWSGWIKNPEGIKLAGQSPKQFLKALSPSGKELFRGAAAGAALQAAEEGELGPIGSISASILADLAASGVAGGFKAAAKAVRSPKQALAEGASLMTKADKLALQEQIINDFRNAGIQADLGSITDNNLIRWTQAKLAASGLTGDALDNFRNKLTQQIAKEYTEIADNLGSMRFETQREAGQTAQQILKAIHETDLDQAKALFKNARNSLATGERILVTDLEKMITGIEKDFKPGSIKGPEQKAVLDALETLRNDIVEIAPGEYLMDADALINNKVSLNSIINWEAQGGAKTKLREVTKALDKAAVKHSGYNPKFGRAWIEGNKAFSKHAKIFRNRNISQMLRTEDPGSILNKMNNPQAIADLEKALSLYPEGRELFNDLKRYKLEEIVAKNMVDSTTQQIKLGSFATLLEKGKRRDIVKSLLGKRDYNRLVRLQNNAAKLADSANKFYNSSKTASVAADLYAVTKALKDGVTFLTTGNPFPAMISGATLIGGNRLAKLLANPEFLKLAEEAIIARNAGKTATLRQKLLQMAPIIAATQEAAREFRESDRKGFRS